MNQEGYEVEVVRIQNRTLRGKRWRVCFFLILFFFGTYPRSIFSGRRKYLFLPNVKKVFMMPPSSDEFDTQLRRCLNINLTREQFEALFDHMDMDGSLEWSLRCCRQFGTTFCCIFSFFRSASLLSCFLAFPFHPSRCWRSTFAPRRSTVNLKLCEIPSHLLCYVCFSSQNIALWHLFSVASHHYSALLAKLPLSTGRRGMEFLVNTRS